MKKVKMKPLVTAQTLKKTLSIFFPLLNENHKKIHGDYFKYGTSSSNKKSV